MTKMEAKGDRMVCEFIIPSRGIIGLRNQLLTATAGRGHHGHRFLEYQPMKGDIPQRPKRIVGQYGKRESYSVFH